MTLNPVTAKPIHAYDVDGTTQYESNLSSIYDLITRHPVTSTRLTTASNVVSAIKHIFAYDGHGETKTGPIINLINRLGRNIPVGKLSVDWAYGRGAYEIFHHTSLEWQTHIENGHDILLSSAQIDTKLAMELHALGVPADRIVIQDGDTTGATRAFQYAIENYTKNKKPPPKINFGNSKSTFYILGTQQPLNEIGHVVGDIIRWNHHNVKVKSFDRFLEESANRGQPIDLKNSTAHFDNLKYDPTWAEKIPKPNWTLVNPKGKGQDTIDVYEKAGAKTVRINLRRGAEIETIQSNGTTNVKTTKRFKSNGFEKFSGLASAPAYFLWGELSSGVLSGQTLSLDSLQQSIESYGVTTAAGAGTDLLLRGAYNLFQKLPFFYTAFTLRPLPLSFVGEFLNMAAKGTIHTASSTSALFFSEGYKRKEWDLSNAFKGALTGLAAHATAKAGLHMAFDVLGMAQPELLPVLALIEFAVLPAVEFYAIKYFDYLTAPQISS